MRCDLLIGLGTAQLQIGDVAHRQTLLHAAALARRAGDATRLVAAALANHRGSEAAAGEVDTERVEILTAALDMLEPSEVTTRARLLATLAVELTYSGDLQRVTGLADEAVALARQLDDPAALVHALNSHHVALRLPETLAGRLVTTRETITIADGLGDPWRQFSAHRQRLQASIESGNRADRDRSISVCHEIATRIGQPFLRWVDSQNRATQALLDGNAARAETLAEEAFAIGTESGQPDALTIFGVQLLDVRIHQGRTGELVDLIAEGVNESPGLPALRAALFARLSRRGSARRRSRGARGIGHRSSPRRAVVDRNLDLGARRGAARSPRHRRGPLRPSPAVGRTDPHCSRRRVRIHRSLPRGAGRATRTHRRRRAPPRRSRAQRAAHFGSPFYIARTLLQRAELDVLKNRADAQARAAEALVIATEHQYPRLERAAFDILEAD